MDWKEALKLEFDNGALGYMAAGLKGGGFPMGDGGLMSWSDWLAKRIEDRIARAES